MPGIEEPQRRQAYHPTAATTTIVMMVFVLTVFLLPG